MSLCTGEKLILTINDIAFGGEGVARLGDFVVFVPFTCVGESVEAEVVEVKKRFARARLVKVLTESPKRAKPPCSYFGDCGGCQYQHIDYPTQLDIKGKQVRDLFQRIGRFDPALVSPVIPCPQPYGYRNRIMIRSQWDKFKQGLNIGFIRHDNRLVVDITECKIAEPVLSDRIKDVRANPPPKGGIKVVLRVPPEGWQVPPDSFFQNNFFLLPRFVDVVRERLQSAGTRFLLDIYCGVGFFSLELAHVVERFIGIELDQLAIKAARKNAELRNLTNGHFIAGSAEAAVPNALKEFPPGETTLLLDPPRKGCHEGLLQLIREVRPAQVIYVSCHPATMTRDLNILCAENVFKVAQVVPLDMFPQTSHIECVSDLRLSPSDGHTDSATP